MLNRDFSKTKKEYLLKNKVTLIIIASFLVVGILFLSIWGLNTNPDFSGCNRVEVAIGKEVSDKDMDDYSTKINSVLNRNNCEVYAISLKGEGDSSVVEIKYTGKTSEEKINTINADLASKLEISISNISEHEKVSKTVSAKDYIYTALACILIVLFTMIFVWTRHNLAYAICMLGADAFAFVALILTMAIFRIQISSVFFFVVVATVLFTSFEALILFENMREIRKDKKYKDDLSKQLTLGFRNMARELQFASIGLFTLGFLFVIFGTQASRLVALTFMFGVLISLMTMVFILPLIYNLIADLIKFKKITTSNKSAKTNLTAKTDDKEKVEAEVKETVQEEVDVNNSSVDEKVDEAKDTPQDEK